MTVSMMRYIALPIVAIAAACSGTRPADTPDTSSGTAAPYVAADADFMRNMIGHHGQAIDMADLVPGRSSNETLANLARRIDESQVFEIGLMQRWLEARNESTDVPHDMAGMAGMATPEQMAELADAQDGAFDKLFLHLMTRHHRRSPACNACSTPFSEVGNESSSKTHVHVAGCFGGWMRIRIRPGD